VHDVPLLAQAAGEVADEPRETERVMEDDNLRHPRGV
jgi:hypothetical protein